jgi:hypothetical protein
MRVCPECRETTHMYRKIYPEYVKEMIFFDAGSDRYYDIDYPLYPDNISYKEDYFCANCDHLYKGNDIGLIVIDEMVEKEDAT